MELEEIIEKTEFEFRKTLEEFKENKISLNEAVTELQLIVDSLK